MKYIKRFEDLEDIDLEDIKTQIEYAYIQQFQSEDDYYEFCKDVSNVDDVDDVDWDYIPQDVATRLALEEEFPNVLHPTLVDIVTDIMTEINLDKCDELRELSYEDYKIRKKSSKYNL